jgi:hypothetical protein
MINLKFDTVYLTKENQFVYRFDSFFTLVHSIDECGASFASDVHRENCD